MELDLAHIHEAIAAAVPTRECIVWRDRRLTWADITERTRRLANLLFAHRPRRARRPDIGRTVGVGARPSRAVPHQLQRVPRGHARRVQGSVAPFNVNYRYVADELAYLLRDARTSAVVYHGRYAPLLADVLPQLDDEPVLLLQVDDESGNDLLRGALEYEEALAASDPGPPPIRTES